MRCGRECDCKSECKPVCLDWRKILDNIHSVLNKSEASGNGDPTMVCDRGLHLPIVFTVTMVTD